MIHSASIRDRDGAALVRGKIQQPGGWLELFRAYRGCNARQVHDAVAGYPGVATGDPTHSTRVPATLAMPMVRTPRPMMPF